MKKFYFVVLSAIMFGAVIVACTSGNERTPINELESPLLSNSSTDTESDWSAFYHALDSLNAKYNNYQPNDGKRSVGLVFPKSDQVASVDATGAVIWYEILKRFPDGSFQVKETTIVISVLYSLERYKEELDTTSSTLQAICNPSSIPRLRSTNPAVAIGEEHNIVIADLLEVDSIFDMTRMEVIDEIISLYEQNCKTINLASKNLLRSFNTLRIPSLGRNVQQANDNFTLTVAPLNMQAKRGYTEEYLDLVDASVLNSNDKAQMFIYATVMYYSSSLWQLD